MPADVRGAVAVSCRDRRECARVRARVRAGAGAQPVDMRVAAASSTLSVKMADRCPSNPSRRATSCRASQDSFRPARERFVGLWA